MAGVKRLPGTESGAAAEPIGDAPTDDRGLTRGERSIIRRISTALKFADLMGVLMVAATLMSAFATWRTAKVTNMLFSVSERPYLGIEQIAFDSVHDGSARVRIDFRNFGHVSATDGVARVWILIDGKRLSGEDGSTATVNVGMVAPSVPQLCYRFVPERIYDAVLTGEAKMIVQSEIVYRGPDQREFCYHSLTTYDHRAGAFVATGGSDRCSGDIY